MKSKMIVSNTLVSTFVFLLVSYVAQGQFTLTLVDEIFGNEHGMEDVVIDERGRRYYALEGAKGRWVVNGDSIDIGPASARPVSSEYDSYVLVVEDDRTRVDHPGGKRITLTDSSYLVMNTLWVVDTLTTADTTLISPYDVEETLGMSMALWEKGRGGGALLKVGFWTAPNALVIEPWDMRWMGDRLFTSFRFYNAHGAPTPLGSLILKSKGRNDILLVEFSEDLDLINDFQVDETFNSEFIAFDIIGDQVFMGISSEEVRVVVCGDTLAHPAHDTWHSQMPIWLTLDSDLACTDLRSISPYPFWSISPRSITAWHDQLIGVGMFSAPYWSMDGDTAFTDFPGQVKGYLIALDPERELGLDKLMQNNHNGSWSSFSHVLPYDDEHLIVLGAGGADSFEFGGQVLEIEDGQSHSFAIVLNRSLEVVDMIELPSHGDKLLKGRDGKVYIMTGGGGSRRTQLHRLDYWVSSTEDAGVDQLDKIECLLSPNPAMEHITIDVSAPVPQDAAILVRDMQGRVMHEGRIGGAEPYDLDLAGWSAGQYLVEIFTKSGKVTGRFVKVE